MTFVIFGIIALMALIPSLYLRYVRLRPVTRWGKALCWLPIAVMMLTLVLTAVFLHSATVLHLFSALVFCFIMPLLVYTAVSAIGRGLRKRFPQAKKVCDGIGIGLAVVLSLSMLYGSLFGWRKVEVKHVDLYFEDLPEAFDGYRIAQLSDMHVGTYGADTRFVEKVIAKTNAEQADLIVFTGDLINIRAEEVAPFEHALAQLHAPDGVYAVLGNHDYCRYGINKPKAEQEAGLAALKASIGRVGWQLLTDEHVWIHRGKDSLALVGVGNISRPPYPSDGNWRKALEGVPDSSFSILLSHNPEAWADTISQQTSVDLTLSGHTHAAQIKIGSWSPAALMYEQWSGWYEHEGRQIYVSEGLGGTFAFRLGTKPQIVVITMHRK